MSKAVSKIIEQLNEPRPLPMGRKEFDEWAERQIAGSLMQPGKDEDAEIFKKSLKYALAGMLMHLGPTESHKPDAFFIHSLRKFAINQVAHAIITETHAERKAALAAEDERKKAAGEATLTAVPSIGDAVPGL